MSRTLLSERLKTLEARGIIYTKPRAGRRGREYQLTESGTALWAVIEPLAAWGQQWVERQPQHSDPSFVLWAWVHVHLRRERLPKRRVVVQFDFPEQPPAFSRFWILVQEGDAELCSVHPKYDCDLRVRATNSAFTSWHLKEADWSALLRSGEIVVEGPRQLARSLPTWNQRVD